MEMRKYALAIAASMGCAAFGAYLYSRYEIATNNNSPAATTTTVPFESSIGHFVAQTYAPTDFTEAAEQSVNAVVHVKIKKEQKNRQNGYNFGGSMDFSDPFFDFFFGQRPRQRQQPVPRQEKDEDGTNFVLVGAGSGVIISSDGYIVTNNHVIESADKIEVTLNDRTTFDATLIGTDPTTDIALLKIETDGLHYLQFGNSDAIKVGEWVLAVGNPFNLTSTVTAGIVSAKSRTLGGVNEKSNIGIESFIQTDAAVNPGNSGGALVNTRGELIGINTAIASTTGSYSGYSFAVPASIAQKVVQDLKQYGEVQRALLGVSIADVTPELQKEHNLRDVKGVFVAEVSDGGAAKEAGIISGDVIVSVNGESVNTVPALQEKIGTRRPGESVKLGIIREGKSKEIVATLKNVRGTTGIVKLDDDQKLLGATFEPISDSDRENLRIRNGIKVTKLAEGKLKQSGMREGFIIVKANRMGVTSTKDFQQIVATASEGLFISGIYPNGKVAYYAINLEE
ncbi:MAG: Do family serine endopeptidase [Bacteroidales bacterium]|nr:Do family serine endopeptidase [Bacteroidales bacterium]